MLPPVARGVKKPLPLLPSGTTDPKSGRKCCLSFHAVSVRSFVTTSTRMPPLFRLYRSYTGSMLPDILDAINWNVYFLTKCVVKSGLAARFVSLFRAYRQLRGNPNLFVKSGNS
ncbi:unnamed protein product [Ixodes persulcatus]